MNSDSNPFFSIIIPVYNGANYLRDSITSAMAQTYGNFEIIVVNDGSRDNGATDALARSLGDQIRYIAYSENGGVSKAINTGIRAMKGEWFCWLSHDDLYPPDRLAADARFIQQNPQARVIFGDISRVDYDGRLLQVIHHPIHHVSCPHHSMLLGGPNACALTIHRSCFEKAGFLNENNRTAQDVEITIRLAMHYEFFYNPDSKFIAREHSQRGSHTLSERHKVDRRNLGLWFHGEMTFAKIFGPEPMDRETQARAWFWLATAYHFFCSPEYEEECYRKAFSEAGGLRLSWRLKRLVRRLQRNPRLEKWVLRLYKIHDRFLWARQKPMRPERTR